MACAFEAWFHSDVLDGFGGIAPNIRLLYNVQQKPDVTESFHTKNILNKETKTMKRLALLISAVVTVHGTTLAASVFDDAKVWFRGGYDANNDGVTLGSTDTLSVSRTIQYDVAGVPSEPGWIFAMVIMAVIATPFAVLFAVTETSRVSPVNANEFENCSSPVLAFIETPVAAAACGVATE